MARRVSLPAADELFRPTVKSAEEPVVRAVPDVDQTDADDREATPARRTSTGKAPVKKVPAAKRSAQGTSGRVKHDEKMTVYVTSDELLELEHARLALRSVHGLAVDRGRIVREAVALVLADLEARGEDSALVRRLTEE